MITTSQRRYTGLRPLALLLSASISIPPLLVGCGSNNASAPPPIDDTQGGRMAPQGGRMAPQQNTGMSTRKKVVLLVGAAAVYYMYKKHQAKAAAGQKIQYYRSKNGRVYYREPNNPKQVHWVTPPTQGFQVPESEAAQYRDIQGYDSGNTGRSINDLFPAS